MQPKSGYDDHIYTTKKHRANTQEEKEETEISVSAEADTETNDH